MTSLLDWTTPSARFGRSVNVERDAESAVISSYLPTARALDVVRRVGVSLVDPHATRALSVTGPYGSGKSSLAVFLDALLGPTTSGAYTTALRILQEVDPESQEILLRARVASSAGKHGFVRAVITAEREPIVATALRALDAGLNRFPRARGLASVRREVAAAAEQLSHKAIPLPTPRFLRDALFEVARHAPVILMIDEFGKNLEAFGEHRGDADLFFLQTVAEWSQAPSGHPLVAVTLQHLAFEEYVDIASVAMRREWAKVQGRFEDIPFVDSATQTRRLMSSVWTRSDDAKFRQQLKGWTAKQAAQARKAGVLTLLGGSDVVAEGWPLHPVTQLILPELCSRYGQNERTLFSFLASNEPLSVASWLSENAPGSDLGAVHAGRVYDYFVDSASVTVAASQAAGRWLEIETTIRDAVGLSEAHRRVLKVIGLLNLVGAGGALRASRELVVWAAADGATGTKSHREVELILADLESNGRITWREFAAEYRLWRGSDLDLKGELLAARRQVRAEKPAALLNGIAAMSPAIAARHSIRTGTTRVFSRRWIDCSTPVVAPPAAHAAECGLLLYSADGSIPVLDGRATQPKPVVVLHLPSTTELLAAAEEVSAIRTLLRTSDELQDDPVATLELVEREAEALHRFEVLLAELSAPDAEGVAWYRAGPEGQQELATPRTLSAGLSGVCDDAYPATPAVRNELLNRHELSSQAAKARRELLEALIRHRGSEFFGIEGFGPHRSMYDAVFAASGLHELQDGAWRLTPPTHDPAWAKAWSTIADQFSRARAQRLNIASGLLDVLQAPPCGMTAGAAPVLVVVALIMHGGEVALYEHGSYRPRLSVDVCERLVRNPSHFEVKHFGAQRGPRRTTLDALASRLGVAGSEIPSVLSVVSHLAAIANSLPPFARQTRQLSEEAIAFRRALLDAREPDVLLFEVLPSVLGFPPIPARTSNRFVAVDAFALAVKRVLGEVATAYDRLLDLVLAAVRENTASPERDMRQSLSLRSSQLDGQVLDPRLRGLLTAIRASGMDDREWAEYVAMTVAGPPPGSWTDEDLGRFRHTIVELGGTLRRLEAIQFDRRAADGEPFEAMRLTVTKSDGSEHARVVAVDAETQTTLSAFAERVFHELDAALGGSVRGREALVAIMADRLMASASQPGHIVPLVSRQPTPDEIAGSESHG